MKYTQTKPCNLCPFRRDAKALTVSPSRARDFAMQMLSTTGSEFVCHKTAELRESDDGGSEYVDKGEESQHCAGALIFAEKNGHANQMMRICERIGAYDPQKLMSQPAAVLDTVFDDLDEMVEASRRKFDQPKKKAKKTRRKR